MVLIGTTPSRSCRCLASGIRSYGKALTMGLVPRWTWLGFEIDFPSWQPTNQSINQSQPAASLQHNHLHHHRLFPLTSTRSLLPLSCLATARYHNQARRLSRRNQPASPELNTRRESHHQATPSHLLFVTRLPRLPGPNHSCSIPSFSAVLRHSCAPLTVPRPSATPQSPNATPIVNPRPPP